MEKQKSVELNFTKVGLNDHLPYAKADIVKVSNVSDNFSLSFYQLDYQALALSMSLNETIQTPSDMLISVGKIVLNKQSFHQLYAELTEIKQKMETSVVK